MNDPTLNRTICIRRICVVVALVAFFSVVNAFDIATAATLSPSELSLPNDKTKLRFRCRVAYDGSSHCGFQLQENGKRTVQGELEQVLSKRFDRPIRVVGAGRTDAGVNARGQAIHFDLIWDEVELTEDWCMLLQTALNRMVRQDIRIWNLGPAPPPQVEVVNGKERVCAWNSMRKATRKMYSYRICLADFMDPMERHTRWQIDQGNEVDVDQLADLLDVYEGTHDFVCFAGALEATARKTGKELTTTRTVFSAKLVPENDEYYDDGVDRRYYRIDFYLSGALYKMVRNLVGTALDASRGILSGKSFRSLVDPAQNGKNRRDNKCKPAPPQGLTLERVFYDDDFF